MPVSEPVLSACCFLLLCSVASAQITITQGDIPSTIGDSSTFKMLSSGSTAVNVGSAGGPQTWTFDTASYAGYVVGWELVDRDSTPAGPQFPEANLTGQEMLGPYGFWIYRKLDATQMVDLGPLTFNTT